MRLELALIAILITSIAGCEATFDDPGPRTPYADWHHYEGDLGGLSFSSLSEIDRTNVDLLEVAWSYSPETVTDFNPVVVDTLMYLLRGPESIVALHAGTGEEVWTSTMPPVSGAIRTRGFSYWESDDRSDRRLLFPKGSYHLVALDALTGQPVERFGENGAIDLRQGLGPPPEVTVRATSGVPGVVYEDLIILGSSPGEGYTSSPGHIRAFDVVTGRQEWIFHTLPQPGELGYDTWPTGRTDNSNVSSETARGGANAWGRLSVDAERGIVYVPLGSSSYDFYGVDRLGQNLFANSIVALDARTGERIWYFQTVHHDLWDYDLAATPILLTVDVGGSRRDVVAQATKMGMVFVFDRETGEPIWPIEERAVPASRMPGEEAWPTQPFPTRPEPFIPLSFDPTVDLNEHVLESEKDSLYAAVRAMRYEGMYTPPDTQATLQIPGNLGGANWGSTAGDPRDGTLYVMSRNLPSVLALQEITFGNAGTGGSPIDRGHALYQQHCQTCHAADRRGAPAGDIPTLEDVTHRLPDADFDRVVREGTGRMPPFAMLDDSDVTALRMYLANPQLALADEDSSSGGASRPTRYQTGYNHVWDSKGTPVIKFPWTRLTAYDLNSGTIKWQAPVGEMPHLVEQGIRSTGMGNLNGGPAVTAGGLVFQAAGDHLWAFNRDDGEVLWSGRLPANGKGVPAVYAVDGRQYIFISAPGERNAVPGQQAAYVAFSLP